MTFPESFLSIVKKMAFRYGTNIEKAVENAETAIRQLPEFGEIQRGLVTEAIRHLIHDARHKANLKMRRESGSHVAPTRVTTGSSTVVKRVAESLFNYRIAGTLLGVLTGEDLPGIIESESNIAEGHTFNANLCRKLLPLVEKDKTVKDSVSQAKLKTLFASASKQTARERATA